MQGKLPELALFFIAPLTVVAVLLSARGHRMGPVPGSGVGVCGLYTYTQVIIGQEYLRLPGNIEYWFPLLRTVFILAEVAAVLSWRAMPPELPRPSPRMVRTAAIVLLLMAVFLVFGLHLRSLHTTWQSNTIFRLLAGGLFPHGMIAKTQPATLLTLCLLFGATTEVPAACVGLWW